MKKIKFNVVDIFIIIIALLLITAFAYYANGSIASKSTVETIRYTVSIEGYSDDFIDLIKVGDNVRNIDRACEAGTVVAVTPSEHNIKYNENMEDGTFVAAEIPDEYRCQVTIESPYTNTGLGYYIDQVEIRTGKEIALKTPGFAFEGVIMDIERSDG